MKRTFESPQHPNQKYPKKLAQKNNNSASLKRKLNDTEASYQSPQKRPREEFVCGVIKKIRLENFMCHSTFSMEPNQNVNFITGANGAGKSSILQAIVLGLLGDSKSTKRYSSIGQFVKKDASKAVIEISLNNEGEDAYKKEEYGDTITFVRTIFAAGPIPFQLKDANGNTKEEGKRAREVGKRILENFRIQVENPIIVLNQDEAKEMLKVESPTNLYSFLIKATNIRSIMEDYKRGYSDIETTKRRVSSMKNAFSLKRKQYKDIKEVRDRQKLDDEESTRLKGEYCWALVQEIGYEVKNTHKSLSETKNQLKIEEEKLKKLSDEGQLLEESKTASESKFDEQRKILSTHEDELTTMKKNVATFKATLKTTDAEIKNCDIEIRNCDNQIKDLGEELEIMLGQSGEESKRVEVEKERRKMNLCKQIEETGKLKEKEDKHGISLTEKQNNITESMQNVVSSKRELEIKINSLEKEIKEIEKLGNAKLAVFGKKFTMVEELLKKHEDKFECKPLGPVGSYVHLKSPAIPGTDVANLVESVLSPLLTNYLCHSDRDRRTLIQIFDKVFVNCPKPRITTSTFLNKAHKVDKAKVPLVLMDLLEIDDVNVFNFLVDQAQIESVAVCSDQEEAKRMTTHRQNVPKNLSHALSYHMSFYKFMPPTQNSSYRSYYLDENVQSLLSGSTNEKIRQKKKELQENKLKVKENSVKKIKMQKEMEEIEIEKNDTIQRIKTHVGNISHYKSLLKGLTSETECDTSQSLKQKLNLKTREKDEIESKRENLLNEKSTAEKELITAKNKSNNKEGELISLKEKWCVRDSNLAKNNVIFSNKRKEIENQEKVTKKLKDDLENLANKKNEAMNEHKKKYAKALERTKPMKPSETKEQLEAKLRKCTERQKERATRDGIVDFKKVEEEYEKLGKEYLELKEKIENQESLLHQITSLNNDRGDMVINVRKSIITRITRNFNFITQSMAKDIGSSIFLNINIPKRELRFKFTKVDTNTDVNTNISSLSGGEKSFAQMALICSLWNHIQPPFRALDEWDVFLDQVNRNKIQKQLYKFGLNNDDKQFIFLSPQGSIDMNGIPPEERSKVSAFDIKK